MWTKERADESHSWYTRSRGIYSHACTWSKVTDIAPSLLRQTINLMPRQLKGINHAAAAGVPMVFAINKIDKPSKLWEDQGRAIKMNYLVEDWGENTSRRKSRQRKDSMEEHEKVLLEADMLDLESQSKKTCGRFIIESSLIKVVAMFQTVLVNPGTLTHGETSYWLVPITEKNQSNVQRT